MDAAIDAAERGATGYRRWRFFFWALYRTAPLFAFVRARRPMPPVEELVIRGRRSGVPRSVLLQLVEAPRGTYVVEPSGMPSHWADNLAAAGRATIRYADGRRVDVSSEELGSGDERDAALDAQPNNQPRPMRFMYRRARLHIGAVGRVFRLAALALLVAGCSQTVSSTSVPASRSPSAAPPSPSAPARCPNPDGGPSNLCLGILSAGTYTTRVFSPRITYTVTDGWGNYEDLPGNFLLVPPGQPLEGVNADTGDFIGIYSGVAAAAANCEEVPEPTAERSAEGMAAWFTGNPGLDATSEPTTIGGLEGYAVDIRLDPAWTGSCPFAHEGEPLVPILVGTGPAGLHHVLNATFAMRLYLLDDGARVVGIEVVDHSGDLGMEDYAAIVETLAFGSAGSAASIGTATLASLTDCTFTAAPSVSAGNRSITAVNALPSAYAGTVELLRIADDHTFDELRAHIAEEIRRTEAHEPVLGPPHWTETPLQSEVRFGETEVVSASLTSGTYGIVCTVSDGTDFRPIEVLGPIVIR
jgi:hypothetical protein